MRKHFSKYEAIIKIFLAGTDAITVNLTKSIKCQVWWLNCLGRNKCCFLYESLSRNTGQPAHRHQQVHDRVIGGFKILKKAHFFQASLSLLKVPVVP